MLLSALRTKMFQLSVLFLGLALLASPARADRAISDQEAKQVLAVLASPDLQQSFPRLGLRYVEVLGPCTDEYNCIAHSLGVNRWVNPLTSKNPDNPLEKMDAMYTNIGYVRQEGMDYRLEDGKEKVAVYATLNEDGTIFQVTHAARQANDGTWTSKLGKFALIRHLTPEALRGPTYGTPVAIYVRTVTLASK